MKDERPAKLDQRVTRRGFLRGSSLAAAAIAAAAVLPAAARAQAPEQKKDDDKKDEPRKDDGKTDSGRPTEPEFLEEHTGPDGRKFRTCPVCGYNMYRQDRTWTCENCGFSYDE